MPYVIDIILSSGSLSIRRFCGGGGGGRENKGPLNSFLPYYGRIFRLITRGEGSYVSHISIIVTTTAWLSDHDKLNKGEQSSDLKK